VEEQLAWVDVRAFEAAIRRGVRAQADRPDLAAAAYEEALGCYAGELLPETDGFLAEREAFRARALGAAMWLAERHGAAGEPARAEALLGRAVAIAPCEEEPYLALMRHHRRQGRPERVRQAYWDHRRARHAALGLPPSEEFEQAHAEITKA
jgi:DNA-binding SARP family transcriptional activator